MQRLLKTYTITVTIQEGNDEFWESIALKSGCDEVVEAIKDCLNDHGFGAEAHVRLERFEERGQMHLPQN